VHHLEADSFHFGKALQGPPGAGDVRNTFADRGRVVATLATRLTDALHPPLGQDFDILRDVQDAVLERSTPDIRNQTDHKLA
jgi:hypothetical protein